MGCPDLETIGRHVDGALPPADESRVAAHVLDCDRCRGEVETLDGIQRALGDDRTWLGPSRCITPGDLLLGLSGGEPLLHVQQHVHGCAACQAELTGLSDALLLHERGTTERVAPGLKSRLKRVGATRFSASGSTIEEQAAPWTPKVLDNKPAASRRTSRRMQSARTSTTARTSGSARVSGTGQSARRRSTKAPAVGGRATPPSALGPAWAWATMSAAAMLLVALALALSPSRPQGDVARGPSIDPLPGPSKPGSRGPLVSDAMSRPVPARRSESAPSGAEPSVGEEPSVDTTYPLPAELQDALPPEEEPADAEPPRRAPFEAPAPEEPTDASRVVGGSSVRAPLPGVGSSPEDAPPPPPPSTDPALASTPLVDDGGQVQLALTRLSGAVSLVRAETSQGLARGPGALTLQVGDRLRTKTGAGAGAFLSLDDGAYELCLDQGTEVVVRAAVGGPVLGLERGRLLAEVTSMPTGKRFVVATAQGTFSVLGTVFGVEADATSSRLLVAEGLVEAHSQLGRAEVAAGTGVSIATGEAPTAPQPVDLGRLAWARPWQARREVLYAAPLDDPRSLNGWQGELTADPTWKSSPGALLLKPVENRYWGLVASAPAGRLRAFRAMPDLYVQFSVWSEKTTKILFETLDGTQNKEFKRGLPDAPAGRWKTYTIPVMELTTYFDPGKHPLREGDLLTDLEVYVGEPGESFKVVLDEFVVFRKVYD